MIKYFGIKPIVVSAGIKTGLKIKTENPKQVGADRIVGCGGDIYTSRGPVIVIDYGTAATYDVVGADGTFEGSSYRSGNPHLCTGNVESGGNAPGSRD